MRRLPAWLVVTLLVLPACAEPPSKEINQAQGALDAARAAGADQYATDEYRAAASALKSANDAVTQRDYRLALNFALDSRETLCIPMPSPLNAIVFLKGVRSQESESWRVR